MAFRDPWGLDFQDLPSGSLLGGDFQSAPITSELRDIYYPPVEAVPSDADKTLTWLSDYYNDVKEYNSAEAIAAFERSQEAVKQQQDWYKMMSDTEIQRRMADLKAAGVNPVLAVGSLGGASSAMSGAAQTSAASVSTPSNANTLTGMLSSSAAVVSSLGSVLQFILPKLSSATSRVSSTVKSLSESTNYNYTHIYKAK